MNECSEITAYTAYEDGTDSVPKRRHLKFKRRGNYPKERINEFDVVSVWPVTCYILCLYAPCNISISYPVRHICVF